MAKDKETPAGWLLPSTHLECPPEPRLRFRPCIDLRDGKVVQIIGGTLGDGSTVTNFVGEESPEYFADLYRRDGLSGGHVIQLGRGNREATLSSVRAYPGGFQVGGGITPENASSYLDAGASHVIVTSYVFKNGRLDENALAAIVGAVGTERLVLDLSCRRKDGSYYVVTGQWQSFTDLEVNLSTLQDLAAYCAEFLVHGVDVEGHRLGIESPLVALLGEACPIPVTYAGGAKAIEDLDLVDRLGSGKVDLTIGSALDIFGGDVPYTSVVEWHHASNEGKS